MGHMVVLKILHMQPWNHAGEASADWILKKKLMSCKCVCGGDAECNGKKFRKMDGH